MTPTIPRLRIALGEYDTGWHSPEVSLTRAATLVREASDAGARLVVLPEMCTTGFTMEPERYAEPIDGPSVRRLAEMASETGVWILAGVATRGTGTQQHAGSYNSAILFSPRGVPSPYALYNKQRLFAYGEEHEHYVPGKSPLVVDVNGMLLSPFVCYDLRFPELFRAVAKRTDLMVIIANWPVARRAHWDALVRVRAIENQCYVVAVNRVGEGGGLTYDGGSVAYDPWGDPIEGDRTASGIQIVDVAADRVAEIRDRYPFLAGLQ
jgi:predicted amidohydrolase